MMIRDALIRGIEDEEIRLYILGESGRSNSDVGRRSYRPIPAPRHSVSMVPASSVRQHRRDWSVRPIPAPMRQVYSGPESSRRPRPAPRTRISTTSGSLRTTQRSGPNQASDHGGSRVTTEAGRTVVSSWVEVARRPRAVTQNVPVSVTPSMARPGVRVGRAQDVQAQSCPIPGCSWKGATLLEHALEFHLPRHYRKRVDLMSRPDGLKLLKAMKWICAKIGGTGTLSHQANKSVLRTITVPAITLIPYLPLSNRCGSHVKNKFLTIITLSSD
ncbi:hypothetical protein EGW08_023654 [Elysia chlorotica]|uniref:Uncharacterized protein n=1 Tax=Elysia chlorotica TaxID=188477 RepID=A0A3S1GYB6_ELYCH|nr:hypothetical protein EGW08_023654 [Elysia chlorotica]